MDVGFTLGEIEKRDFEVAAQPGRRQYLGVYMDWVLFMGNRKKCLPVL